jgi:hypothetical protein
MFFLQGLQDERKLLHDRHDGTPEPEALRGG